MTFPYIAMRRGTHDVKNDFLPPDAAKSHLTQPDTDLIPYLRPMHYSLIENLSANEIRFISDCTVE